MDGVLEVMVGAARAGGEVALAHLRRGTEATLKPDGSPVTPADRGAEEAIAEINVAVPNMALRLVDRAMQVHGAGGDNRRRCPRGSACFTVAPMASAACYDLAS